jgi:hypothetical protein
MAEQPSLPLRHQRHHEEAQRCSADLQARCAACDSRARHNGYPRHPVVTHETSGDRRAATKPAHRTDNLRRCSPRGHMGAHGQRLPVSRGGSIGTNGLREHDGWREDVCVAEGGIDGGSEGLLLVACRYPEAYWCSIAPRT